MEARDFLNTAVLLSKHSDEEHLRTSISRSYYATFLHFRSFLASKGVKKRKEKFQIHAFVGKCLQFCEIKEGTKVAVALQKLEQLRTDSDYELLKTITENDCQDALAKAIRTIDNFDKQVTSKQKNEIAQGAKAYAVRIGWV